jgi:hypothetical protein
MSTRQGRCGRARDWVLDNGVVGELGSAAVADVFPGVSPVEQHGAKRERGGVGVCANGGNKRGDRLMVRAERQPAAGDARKPLCWRERAAVSDSDFERGAMHRTGYAAGHGSQHERSDPPEFFWRSSPVQRVLRIVSAGGRELAHGRWRTRPQYIYTIPETEIHNESSVNCSGK